MTRIFIISFLEFDHDQSMSINQNREEDLRVPAVERIDVHSESFVVAFARKVSGSKIRPINKATIPKSIAKAAALLANDARRRPLRDCRLLVSIELKYLF